MAKNDSRHVVITGASAGVGRATAHLFADKGAKLTVLARSHEGLQSLKDEFPQAQERIHCVTADVSDYAQVERALQEAIDRFGPVDVWINNAMVSVFSPVSEMTAEEYKRVTDVTYLGVVNGTLAALKHMRSHQKGVIVQVGSALAYRSIPLQSAYCAAKHAIVGFSESLRCELLHEQSPIKVTIVHLPAINTPQFDWVKSRMKNKPQPVPPIFQPEVAADAIYWASSHPRKEWFIGWPTVKAVWGDRLAPHYADHYLAKNGFEDQQTDEQDSSDRPNNLYSPLPVQYYRAHGRFDEQSTKRSLQKWFSRYRVALALGGLFAVGGYLISRNQKWQTT